MTKKLIFLVMGRPLKDAHCWQTEEAFELEIEADKYLVQIRQEVPDYKFKVVQLPFTPA